MLLPVDDALARLLALAPPRPAETVALADAAGRYAAAPVVARRTQPATDLSAMDGYALAHADLRGPLSVVGESAAGRPFAGTLARAQAVRIFTGAAMPAGADCVLVQEEATRDGERLTLAGEGPAAPGRNVRVAGLDFTAGDTLIAAGDRITPAALALAAIAGHGTLPVGRRVRVAIVATGDELVEAGLPVEPGRLPESNRAMIAAQLADLPVDVTALPILPDDLPAMAAAFAAVDADVLVTSGGVSVGDHDLVRPALEAAGATIDFWRIALRPGKPMMAGRLGDTVVVGLPGNPVSSFVTAQLFVRPLVAHLAGARDPAPVLLHAPLGDPVPANGERTDFLRGTLTDGRLYTASVQDSSMLRTLARSNVLVRRDPHAPAAAAGEPAAFLLIA